jgi:hypothetical protein
MASFSQTEQIRQIVRDHLRQLGASTSELTRETVLIRQGNYCGHRFEMGEHQAVWFIEEDEVKFYGCDGRTVRVVHPSRAYSGTNVRAA